ncbi:hypothetical protein Q1695_008238 [Nippostrongylus brasiliensis]|nr:hypothetical protein Q1695_008238 [Nippostrongylus brasiliensis]
MNVCCKHGGGEGDDGTKEDAKSESEKTPQLKTCLDIDEVCEEKTQCDEGMGELEAGVWEEAGEVDQRDISPHLKHAPKHVDGKQDAAKPKKKEVTNGKRLSSDKDDVDIEAKLKALEETQAEVVEYKSIMEPVNMDMINVKNEDIRAGSLADLILQVNKVKAEKIERMKNASRQAEAQRYVEEQKERMKNASRQDEAQGYVEEPNVQNVFFQNVVQTSKGSSSSSSKNSHSATKTSNESLKNKSKKKTGKPLQPKLKQLKEAAQAKKPKKPSGSRKRKSKRKKK